MAEQPTDKHTTTEPGPTSGVPELFSAFADFVGLSVLDPWQLRVATYWRGKKDRIWVRGSGKTFLAANLISRSLVAGRKVWAIAKDAQRLTALQRELTALGLEQYVFFYDASPESRQQLADVFSHYKPERFVPVPRYGAPRNAALRLALTRDRYAKIGRPVFDRYPASVVVGLLLESRRKGGEVLLNNQIGSADFTFTGSEYFELRDQLEQTQSIHRRLQLRSAGLENLHTGIFLHQSEDESRAFIAEQLARFSDRARELYRHYLLLTAQFERAESQRLATQEVALRSRIDRVALAVADWEDAERVERSGRPAWQWFFLRRWGRAARRRSAQWQSVREAWERLRDLHEQYTPFAIADWELPAAAAPLRNRLQRYREQLTNWRKRIEEWVRDELMRLNPSTLPAELLPLRPELRRLEKGLEQLVAAVNESGLYQLPLRADMLTSLRQRKFLEGLLEQFEHTERHLEYYRDFYRWQRHWFGLPARLRRVTRRLLTLPAENWPQLFSAWYFEQCLRRSDLPLAEAGEADPSPSQVLRQAERVHLDRHPWIDRKAAKWTPVPVEDYKVFWRNRPRALQNRFPILLTTPEGAAHLSLGNVRCQDLIVETADALDPVEWDLPAERILVTAADPAPKGFAEFFLEGLHRSGPLQPLWFGGVDEVAPGAVITCDPSAALSTFVAAYRSRERAAGPTDGVVLSALEPGVLEALRSTLPPGDQSRIVAPRNLLGRIGGELFLCGPPATGAKASLSAAGLIDVLLSARASLTLVNSMPEKAIAEALLTSGVTADFVWAAAVSYLRYRQSGETAAAEALAREVRNRLQRGSPSEHPLLKEVATLLRERDGRLTFAFECPWRSVYLPAVVTLPDGRRAVLLPAEGFFREISTGSEYNDIIAAELIASGFLITPLDTLAWWLAPEAAAQAVLADWGLST